MNIIKWIVTCLGVAVVVAAAWFLILPRLTMSQEAKKDSYYCPMHPSYTSDRPGKCPICNMELVKRKVKEQTAKDVYYCPMHPSYTSDRPGKCPICNMELVKRKPKEAGQTADDSDGHSHATMPGGYTSVELDEKQRQLMGVRTVEVKKEEVSKTVRAVGYVAHNVDFYKIQNEFIDAYRKYVTIYRDYKRFADRRRNWDVYREIQTKFLEAEHELTLLGLGEPEIAKLRDIKWWQSWDQPELAILRESNNYWVVAQVFERDLGFVEVGQKVIITIPSYHEEMIGVIRSIGGYVDTETRTTRALIEIEGYRGELKANMLAYVDILSELGQQLVVPASSVMDLGTRKIVFMEHGEGVFNPVEIQVAFGGDGYWSVDQGIKEGDKVVVAGNFLLDSESRMRSQMTMDSSEQTGEVSHVQH